MVAGWADYNNDGYLDLYVGNERFAGQLFRNNGDGTFTDVAARAGIQNTAEIEGVTWGDYDNDGDPDLYIANLSERPNGLYRSNGDGTFADVATDLGVDHNPPNGVTFGGWFWDFNNDGWLDLFVAARPHGHRGCRLPRPRSTS